MKVSHLYDQGSASDREDGMFVSNSHFAVLDGVSAPYGPKYPMRKFDGMSGGEMVARVVEQFFGTVMLSRYGETLGLPSIILPEQSLEGELGAANLAVREAQYNAGVDVEDAGELAGAAFAIARIGEETVEIAQVGDCFALWVNYDGKPRITQNQVREHDTAMNDEILRLQREVAKEYFGIALEEAAPEERQRIRGETWNRFCPFLKEARRRDTNNIASPCCYGLMDGQPEFSDMMVAFELPRRELRALLLFSDGMVPWEAMKGMTDGEVAERVYASYKEGGLAYLLRIARGIECRVANVNYMDNAEATAIALDFSDEK